jgi:hypothetical protein
MAKQRGTHQIAGKINNLVYYEQKYIRGGLIRRQNEAMSSRLKEDIVFAGTREANSLFGACMMMSGAVLSVLGYRRNLMVKPSVNGLLTASILRMYQTVNSYSKSAPINLGDYDAASFLESTDVLMKNRISRYFYGLNRIYNNVPQNSSFDIDIDENILQDFSRVTGCERIKITVMPCVSISSIYRDGGSGKFVAPTMTFGRVSGGLIWRAGDGNVNITQDTLSSSESVQLSAIIFSPIYYTKDRIDYYRNEYITSGYIWLNMRNQ